MQTYRVERTTRGKYRLVCTYPDGVTLPIADYKTKKEATLAGKFLAGHEAKFEN